MSSVGRSRGSSRCSKNECRRSMEQHGGMLSKSFVANTMIIVVIITTDTSTTTTVIVVIIVAIIIVAGIISSHRLKHHTSIDYNVSRVNIRGQFVC